MGRVYRERRIYGCSQAEVRAAAERAVYELGMAIKPASTEWELQADRTMSALSWGERIKALMATSPGGGTQVLLESKLVFGFIDWGRNQQNVESFFETIETIIGPGEPAPLEV
jgi:hypothetical protein